MSKGCFFVCISYAGACIKTAQICLLLLFWGFSVCWLWASKGVSWQSKFWMRLAGEDNNFEPVIEDVRSAQFSPLTNWVMVGEGNISRDPLTVFPAVGHFEQFWHCWRCPLFDVHPAFLLLTLAASVRSQSSKPLSQMTGYEEASEIWGLYKVYSESDERVTEALHTDRAAGRDPSGWKRCVAC